MLDGGTKGSATRYTKIDKTKKVHLDLLVQPTDNQHKIVKGPLRIAGCGESDMIVKM